MKRILSSTNVYFARSLYAIEQLLGFYLFFGGISTATSPTIAGTNAVAAVLGSHWSLITLGLTFMIMGLLLILSRILDNDHLHGWTLMAIYAMMVFTVLIEIFLGTNFADSLSLTVISGFLYLRAKKMEPWRRKHHKHRRKL